MSCHSWYEAKLLADARIQDRIRIAEKARMVRRVKRARATAKGSKNELQPDPVTGVGEPA